MYLDAYFVPNLKEKKIPFLGYYRVNYDRKNWDLIIEQLNSDPESIHVLNRAQIINDAFNLVICL